MKFAPLVFLLLLSALASAMKVPNKDFAQRNYFVVEIDTANSSAPLQNFIASYSESYRFEYPVRGLDDHFVFSVEKSHPHASFLGNHNSNDYNHIKRAVGLEDAHDALISQPGLRLIHMLPPKTLERRMPVAMDDRAEQNVGKREFNAVDSSQLPLKEVADKLDISDPIFAQQWHLVNTINPGHDVNVKNVWYNDNMGQGITVAVIDDGVDVDLDDLRDNFNPKGSWDFNDNNRLPKPRLFDDYHGTRCAGEIAAVKNDVCGVGVAYKAKVAGIRILSGPITSEEEAAAMMYGLDVNDIFSCSWGPTDNGMTVAGPDMLVKKAIIKGIQEGRNNKGSLYVFASGNGGRVGDQCNFDGYTNSIYSITVGAIDYKGLHPSYAEACSAVMVVTYSSGSLEHIHTSDIKKKCSATHGGTSAAAPLAAGIYALALLANPDLTWRDLQYVSAMAAIPVNEDDGDYQVGALGQKYSHKYGYGKLDAEKLVETAKNWKNVKPQAWHYSDVVTVDKAITAPSDKDSEVISSTITITKEAMQAMNLARIEHVNIKVNVESHFRGKIGVRLLSPSGIVSHLARFRPMDNSGAGLKDWVFMSVAHFGEDGLGDWKLEMFSQSGNDIKFKDWQLRFYGESIDAEKAEKYDVEKDYAAVRRERLADKEEPAGDESSPADSVETEAPEANTETTPETTAPETSALEEVPVESATDTQPTSTSESSTLPSGTEDDGDHEGANKHYYSSHAGQYFMALTVIGFIAVIVVMKLHKTPGSSRRRRREDFEFDIIPGEDYSDSDEDDTSLDVRSRDTDEMDRERLFEDFNAESLPDYDDDMFQIGVDEDLDKNAENHGASGQDKGSQSGASGIGNTASPEVSENEATRH